MAKFPEPPPLAVLAGVAPDIRILAEGTRVWRIYFSAGAHPTTWNEFRSFGPTSARFDHHLPPPSVQERKVLYGAIGEKAAVTTIAEVFQATRVVERAFRSPAWVAFDVGRDVRLLDLMGAWPTRAGASMAVSSGVRARSRRWSQAIYDAFPDVDGLVYPSSMHAGTPCVALYERAEAAVPKNPMFHRQLLDPIALTLLKNACREVGYLLQ